MRESVASGQERRPSPNACSRRAGSCSGGKPEEVLPKTPSMRASACASDSELTTAVDRTAANGGRVIGACGFGSLAQLKVQAPAVFADLRLSPSFERSHFAEASTQGDRNATLAAFSKTNDGAQRAREAGDHSPGRTCSRNARDETMAPAGSSVRLRELYKPKGHGRVGERAQAPGS